MIRYLWLIVCFLALFSCSGKVFEPKVLTDIKIPSEVENIELEELLSNYKIVPVYSDQFIPSVYRVFGRNGSIFFTDGKKSKIFKQSETGNAIEFIQSLGDGPGEYHEIRGVKYDASSRKIFILDKKLFKILVFDEIGNFKNEYFLDKSIRQSVLGFEILDESNLLFRSNTSSGFTFIRYNLINGEFTFISPNEEPNLGFGNDLSLSKFNKSFSVVSPFVSKISVFDNDLEHVSDLNLDFGKFSITNPEIENIGEDQEKAFSLIQDDIVKKAHSFGIMETESYYIVSYNVGSFNSGDYRNAIISKNSNLVKCF